MDNKGGMMPDGMKDMPDRGMKTGMEDAHKGECTMNDIQRGYKKHGGESAESE